MFNKFLPFTFLVTFFVTVIQADTSSRAYFDLVPPSSKVYSYSPHGGMHKHHAIFKFADLLTRARKYKEAHPNEDVIVNLALYKVNLNVYVGINPDAGNSYGWVGGSDFDGDNTEKFLYTIRRAEDENVSINFLYHKSEDINQTSNYLDNSGTEYFKKINWGNAVSKQMHNKFITVNVYEGDDDTVVRDTIYTSTSNIDIFDSNEIQRKPKSVNLSQSGILVSEHPCLYASYNTYFQILWDNAEDYSNFKGEMSEKHANNQLNYKDKYFSAYFFPLDKNNLWEDAYNPIAKMVTKMESASALGDKSYVKINTYTVNSRDQNGDSRHDEFTQGFNERMKDINETGALHLKAVIKRGLPTISNFNGTKIGNNVKTHNKVYLFAFPANKEYYSIVGSANFKSIEFKSKANNLLMIKEEASGSENTIVYSEFKAIFNDVYKNVSN